MAYRADKTARLLTLPGYPVLVCALLAATTPLLSAQNVGTVTASATISADAGRPLASLLTQIEKRFQSPITFEEEPFENKQDLDSPAVKSNPAPNVALTMTLGDTDTTPYFAAASAVYAYTNAGLPGKYRVVQNSGWVSVEPVEITGAGGQERSVKPVMSYPASVSPGTHNGIDTLGRIAGAVSRASGVPVILLNVPFWPSDTITTDALAGSAGDVIAAIGRSIHRPVTFHCLYDTRSKKYYLNVTIVAPDPVPGTATPPRPILGPGPLLGPSNSPWFTRH